MARVSLIVVSQSSIEPKTCSDLIGIARNTDCAIGIAVGGSLQDKRFSMAFAALAGGSTHVGFLDGDMRATPDTVQRMVKANVDIVGANYRWRHAPVWCATRNGERIDSTRRTGLEVVDDLGLGCVLIKANVFRSIALPWFDMPWDESQRAHHSEHSYFFEKARRAGFKVYVDHDLSQHVRHTGNVEYGVKGATYSTSDIFLPWSVEALDE